MPESCWITNWRSICHMDPEFDADKLYLSKGQILGIGDRLIRRWKLNEKANKKMILIAKAAQFIVGRYKASEIETYYKDFWKEAYEIMYSNAKAGMPELKLLSHVKEPEIVSELDFSIKKVLSFGGMK